MDNSSETFQADSRLAPYFSQLEGKELDKVVVQSFLLSLPNNLDVLAEAEFSDVRPYGRRLLYRSATVEILLMGFLPGRVCPPHDHGRSEGLVMVCSGLAEHSIYQHDQDTVVLADRTLEAAGQLLDSPTHSIHAMRNPGPGPLVTLHIYWPPIISMSIYDIPNRRVYEVNEEAGAWLPVAPETMISIAEFRMPNSS